MSFLITGATGFLGKYLVSEVAKQLAESGRDECIYILARPQSIQRSRRDFSHIDSRYLEFIEGDITMDGLVVNRSDASKLKKEVRTVLHAAAYYDLAGNHKQSYLTNVYGTQNLINFCKQMKKLKHFGHVSTIAVSGDHVGVFRESDLDCGQVHSNHYSQTKHESERIVRQSRLACHKYIYRSGVIVADSESGMNIKKDGPYYVFSKLGELLGKKTVAAGTSLMAKTGLKNYLKHLPLPVDPKAIIPIIAVDQAARLIGQHLFAAHLNYENEDRSSCHCYHVFNPDSPKVLDLFQESFEYFGIDIKFYSVPYTPLYQRLLGAVDLPAQLLDYMYLKTNFDQSQFLNDFSSYGISHYADYKQVFYEGARQTYLS